MWPYHLYLLYPTTIASVAIPVDTASEAAHTVRMARPAPLLVATEHRELPEPDFPDTLVDMKGTGTHSLAGNNRFVVADTVAGRVGMVDRAGTVVDTSGSGSTMYAIRPG